MTVPCGPLADGRRRDSDSGNAGIIFWSDILLPAIGFALLWSAAGREAP
jgi:hypothetical protein